MNRQALYVFLALVGFSIAACLLMEVYGDLFDLIVGGGH